MVVMDTLTQYAVQYGLQAVVALCIFAVGAMASRWAGNFTRQSLERYAQVRRDRPKAEIRLEGRRVVRSEVSNDWASRLQWKISRNGQIVGTAPARADMMYEHADQTPGSYEVVLEMWKYETFKAKDHGRFPCRLTAYEFSGGTRANARVPSAATRGWATPRGTHEDQRPPAERSRDTCWQ